MKWFGLLLVVLALAAIVWALKKGTGDYLGGSFMLQIYLLAAASLCIVVGFGLIFFAI